MSRLALFLMVYLFGNMGCFASTISPDEAVMIDKCILAASQKYQIHPDILRAIRAQEAGYRGAAIRNTNRSIDYGYTGINSINLPTLGEYGVTKEMLMYDPCASVGAMAWFLAKHLAKAKPGAKGFWEAVGNYNSKTPEKNRIYQEKVWRKLVEIRRMRGEQ